ncbi:tail fiber assembly protein [Cedecea lapagei]|uniref:tail fiber assembly protein n=1 Tax=Cedecea lapagei TaxID=158823 RepID=UPI001BCE9DD7|nr:tail fiber assembly protein [Cedecea lapagei]
MKSVYSPGEHAIYPVVLYEEYKRRGTWPADGIEISDADAIKFNGSNEPSGKYVGQDENGKLCWIDRPAPVLTHDELVARAEQQRQGLIDAAMLSISVIQLKMQAQRKLTPGETTKLNATLDYIDTLTAMDTTAAPDIKWPEMPAG